MNQNQPKSQICRKCYGEVVRIQSPLTQEKLAKINRRRQSYHFLWYDRCLSCGTFFMDELAKRAIVPTEEVTLPLFS